MIIYKATNKVNGKSYIGQTARSLDIRIKEHINDAKHNADYPFCKAIHKYGIENFTWEIIVDCGNSQKLLNEGEKFFIDGYNTKIPNGYNLTDGGEGNSGWIPSEKTRQRMRKPKSQEAKRNMSESHKNIPLSETHCQNISLALTGIPKSEKHKQNLRKPKPPGTPEHHKNFSKARCGEKRPPRTKEWCENISKAKRGKKTGPMTEERKRNMSIAQKLRRYAE
jgi:group I intron endonuclease